MINIKQNGSKWAGDAPDPIEGFKERLKTATLDPYWAPFIEPGAVGVMRFSGNFWDYSHGFDISTDEGALIVELAQLITANASTDAYAAAKVTRAEMAAERLAREEGFAARMRTYR